jgi:tRNA uridine 5-carboxymethylaminomethyl modification enzyme
MFTSRAEYRLLLREDNADLRLTPAGRELGVVGDSRWRAFESKRETLAEEQRRLQSVFVHNDELQPADREILGADLQRACCAAELLRRPELGYADVASLSMVGRGDWDEQIDTEQTEQIELQLEAQAKYRGYIERQQREIERHAKQESLRLPEDLDYSTVTGLSTEARQRLLSARPATLGQASRLEGMTPSAVSLLLIHLKKRQLKKSA